MNLKEIKEIIKLMNDNELAEIEVEREGSKLKLKKTCGDVVFASPQPVARAIGAPTILTDVQTAEQANQTKRSNLKEIASPMVGTFYRAPSPESPPFVEVGQIIEKGKVVCIVEAMKLMNEIKSDIKGKIVEIPVENAQPVEFGQVMFYIEPV